MATFDTFSEWIGSIPTGDTGKIEPDNDGSVILNLDDNSTIIILFSEEAQKIGFIVYLESTHGYAGVDLLKSIMQLSFSINASHGASIGIDSSGDNFVLSRTADVRSFDSEIFLSFMNETLQLGNRVKSDFAILRAAIASMPDETPGREEDWLRL